MAQDFRVYLSKRNIALLYIGRPVDVPIITMENYTKWYGIYLVMPDGTVEAVDPDVSDAAAKKLSFWPYGDHLFHPQLLIQLRKDHGWEVDERALECAGGRWVREHDMMYELVQANPMLNFGGENDCFDEENG
jgi:hypothetical protein